MNTPFQQAILEGIPAQLPQVKPYDTTVSHAPKRVIEGVLSPKEKKLAIKNALRYFAPEHHATLAPEFAEELEKLPGMKMRPTLPVEEVMNSKGLI